jgi:hypothetical protein
MEFDSAGGAIDASSLDIISVEFDDFDLPRLWVKLRVQMHQGSASALLPTPPFNPFAKIIALSPRDTTSFNFCSFCNSDIDHSSAFTRRWPGR